MKDFNHTIIFKALVGSQAYGTALPTSDEDYKGVYVQPDKDILCFNYKEQYEVSKDECYFEIRRFIELLRTANPTVLELLYSPKDCVLIKHPAFEIVESYRDKFLTKTCRNSFGGYAIAQIKKAKGTDKKLNWEEQRVERKEVLNFCYIYENGKTIPVQTWLDENALYQQKCGLVGLDHFRDCYAVYYDYFETLGYRGIVGENSNDVRLASVPKGYQAIAIMHFNKDGYSRHCKDYYQYQTWLAERNEARFVDVKGHGQKIDGKNMLHCRRLLDVAHEIAKFGTINVRRPNAGELIKIRKGEIDLQSLIDHAESEVKGLDEAFANSTLPEKVDDELCNQIVLEVRECVKYVTYETI